MLQTVATVRDLYGLLCRVNLHFLADTLFCQTLRQITMTGLSKKHKHVHGDLFAKKFYEEYATLEWRLKRNLASQNLIYLSKHPYKIC